MRIRERCVGATAMVFVLVAGSQAIPFGPATSAHAETAPVSPFVKTGASGEPARWNPCGPLVWKIAGIHPSRRLRLTARKTFEQVSAITGLRFAYAGRATSAEFIAPSRNTIVVGATANLGMVNAGGMTNLFYESTPGGGWAISGARVAINPIVLPGKTRFSSMLMPIVLHEVGHAMGLAHVADSSEIMYPQVVKTTRYTPGARGLLRRLGSAMGCLSTAAPTA